MEDKIFKYIDPDKNDIFSDFRGSDLQDLLVLIDECNIRYREKLDFLKDITFGLELEFENVKYHEFEKKFNSLDLKHWVLKEDASLHNGAEINSPILTDEKKCWNDLRDVCILSQKYGNIDLHSGGHVHIGAHILGNKELYFLNFIKLWSVYENVIYRFGYGEFLTERKNVWKYAAPVANAFWDDFKLLNGRNLASIKMCLSYQRKQAVNFNNVQLYGGLTTNNTIEFRCPNGTLNPVIWQNNVNLFVKLLEYSKNKKYNDGLLFRRHEMNGKQYSNLDYYKEVYLDEALELSDLIFTNNLDKIYFLRQYLKSLKVGNEKLEKAKKFTLY